jgi:hypothetical protein
MKRETKLNFSCRQKVRYFFFFFVHNVLNAECEYFFCTAVQSKGLLTDQFDQFWSSVKDMLSTGITFLLTPWSRDLPEKLTGRQLLRKFPVFYWNWMFITTCSKAGHLSHPDPDQFSPCHPFHSLKIYFNIILPSTPGYAKWSQRIAPLHVLFYLN